MEALVRTCLLRETEILVEQQPPQGVLVFDHAGLVINKFSHLGGGGVGALLGHGQTAAHLLCLQLRLHCNLRLVEARI